MNVRSRRVIGGLACILAGAAMFAFPVLAVLASCLVLVAVARAAWSAPAAPEEAR